MRKSKRRKPGGGIPQPDRINDMSNYAVDVAVSEIAGVPLERLCGHVLIALEHADQGKHFLSITCMANDYQAALPLLENGLADLRQTVATHG